MIEPGIKNIYWTEIKLRAAANQTIYLVIFQWVVGSLYLNWSINFTTRPMFVGERSDQSRYMPEICFELKKWGDISYAVPSC